MSGLIYASVALLPCVAVFALWRVLPSLVVRRGRIAESDTRGTAFVVGAVLGLLLGVGAASYSTASIAGLPLLVALVTLLLVATLGLIGRYYLFLRSRTTPALLLLAGLFPAMVKAGELTAGPVAATGAIAGIMILVPIGISAAAYLVNQFEGYGDVGMAAVAIAALSGVAFLEGETEALLMLLAGLGATIPLLAYASRRPAKTLIGDIGTFTVGALVAVSAISGGLELPAAIIFIPYFLNLGLRACGRSLGQLVMRVSGGSQRRSALILIGSEAVFGLIAVLMCAQS